MKFRPYATAILSYCQAYKDAHSYHTKDHVLIERRWNQFAKLTREVGLNPYKVCDILDGYST